MKRSSRFLAISLSLMLVFQAFVIAPISWAADFDITLDGSQSATVNNAIFKQSPSDSSTGTGIFTPFVRVQGNGTESGYNTDGTTEFDTKTGKWTHAIKLSDIPTVDVQGKFYRELLLDLNETKNDPYIQLDEFEIWLTKDKDISGYPFTTDQAIMVFSLEGESILLDYRINSGSGWGDYKALIPDELFAGYGNDYYFVLFSKLTQADSGFEEWGVLSSDITAAPSVDIEKLISIDDGETWLDADTSEDTVLAVYPGTVHFKVIIENTGNVPLTNVAVTDFSDDSEAIDFTGLNDYLGLGDKIESDPIEVSTILRSHANTATINAYYGKEKVTDSDSANYYTLPDPKIAINKTTNGDDDLDIIVGSDVTWEYEVTNIGNVPLSGISVNDSDENVTPAYVSGDTNEDDMLDLTETWIFKASGTAIQGSYSNTGYVSGTFEESTATADDDSNYFGYIPDAPAIQITKTTNGDDGLEIEVGSEITWSYEVTNKGNVALGNITVTDSDESITPVYVSGDANTDGNLDLTETWIYEATGTAIEGNYSNTGYVSGTFEEATYRDDDDSSYFGYIPDDPAIQIIKTTNGNDGLEIEVGSEITWRYEITNKGNVALGNITVTDSDESITPVYVSGDANTDGKLDLKETWIYEATGTAIEGNYSNIGYVSGSFGEGTVNDNDDSYYTGYVPQEPKTPEISINKTTNGSDGSRIRVGTAITWEYKVETVNGFDIYDVDVTDSDTDLDPQYVSGDDGDGVLEPGETWIYQATGTAVSGLYENIGYVTGYAEREVPVSDEDTSSYTGYTVTTTTTTRRTPDPDPGNIEIFKFLDSDGNGSFDEENEFPFENIRFQLYDEDKGLIETASTDDEGMLTFRNLDAGTYYIKEARNDYSITTGGFDENGFYEVDVDEDETVEIEVGNYREVIPPQEPPLGPPPEVEEILEEKVPQGPPLPQTGEIPPYFAYGIGSLLILAGAFMRRKF
ncbi:prealbumin-like fold domain-containing protein [Acidaminobacter hydrogenoformans]|uniref:LPXTG-motif cell wall anchor domain-containing protein/conserved repeat domain-containing protein n=1 Tax=Acidaminobacter hydrogenoformans DSM 2784 TaxID=1120920 RepID=A0A1G5RQN1_9FIRM|nr:prealbumin-like fold domain-containing protein [Acidaminobacter hydrogenoformans]SCZ76393.1 LPXTG-motif cell wall anchor domain-containing protein/conserved repeat domain-containing protein [Acidaminobacter hydrogenoformans DSM 2784]